MKMVEALVVGEILARKQVSARIKVRGMRAARARLAVASAIFRAAIRIAGMRVGVVVSDIDQEA